jgi:hypothetical protein
VLVLLAIGLAIGGAIGYRLGIAKVRGWRSPIGVSYKSGANQQAPNRASAIGSANAARL